MNEQLVSSEDCSSVVEFSDEQLVSIGLHSPSNMPPWGIGSTRKDYLRAVRSVLRAAASPAVVSPRHPTVVKWRQDGIVACVEIADRYGHHQAAQDMRALLQGSGEPVR